MTLITRRALAIAIAVPALAVVTMAIEVTMAITAPKLPAHVPYQLDQRLLDQKTGSAIQTVVWLGDSTAAGVGASQPSSALPRQVAALSGQSVNLIVLAKSGAKIGDVLRWQLPLMATLSPDVIYLSIGANNVTKLTSTTTFRNQYREVLDSLPATAHVVVLGVPDMGNTPRFLQPLRAIAGFRGRQLDHIVRSLCRTRTRTRATVTYVDIAGTTGNAFGHNPHRYFAADGFHPNDAGYGLWAAAVHRATG